MPVRGIERVKRNLRVKVQEIDQKRTGAAMHAILSQGGAAAATMTPVDTSTLINSQYTDIQPGEGKTTGTVGYTAAYAVAVHSKPGTLKGEPRPNGNGKFWDPSGEPKFLEKGFEEIKPAIPAILKAAYRG